MQRSPVLTLGERPIGVRDLCARDEPPDGHVCVTFENARIEERADRSLRNPGFAQDERYPVVCVNWDEAKAFVVWLSMKTGKPYRLLSGAEREYVTRAGTTTRYSLGNDDRALLPIW